MKKIVLALAVMAITGIAPIASAQTEKSTCSKATTECSGEKSACCKGKPEGMRRKDIQPRSPFEALNLTTEQKGKLEALNTEMRNKKDAVREDMAAADSVMHSAKEDLKREYLKGVKEILTVDQYVQFLEDHYVKSQEMSGRGNKPGMRKVEMRHDPNGPKKMRIKENAEKVEVEKSSTSKK